MANPVDGGGGRSFKEQLALTRLTYRHDLWVRIINLLQIPVALIPVIWIARAFAGKQTTVTIGVTVAVTVALSGIIAASNLSLRRKLKAQGTDLQRLRDYVRTLEGRLGLPPGGPLP